MTLVVEENTRATMKKSLFIILSILFIQGSFAYINRNELFKDNYSESILFGYVPGEYLKKDKNSYFKAAITIKNQTITKIEEMNSAPLNSIELKRPGSSDYDVIYPGLFNLHNHTKQNVLGVWKNAKGQFQNRFEWRGWNNYKDSVSGNMNPWITLGSPVACASFRYSELQAMALGTTYLQGPSSCVSNFAINRVEDSNSFLNYKKLKSVQAPTDLIYPNEMTFVYNEVMPIMMEKANVKTFDELLEKLANTDSSQFNYETGLKEVVKKYCPELVKKYTFLEQTDSKKAVSSSESLSILKDPKNLDLYCDKTQTNFTKFRRYTYFIHPTIAGKKEYLSQNYSAIIAHLSEGRRQDPYNKIEFKLLRLLGLDAPRVNLIHGVGIDKNGFEHMTKKGMGLIWSPFSNHLLYNETADIETAMKIGQGKLLIALGSDWTPTGSRGTLEEVKMARKYLIKNKLDKIFKDEQGKSISMDEALYKMMTSNPAKMVGHEGEAGTIAPNAAASLIVTTKIDQNPYTNLVQYIDENQINLVIVDGKPVYGNLSLVEKTEKAGLSPKPINGEYEDLGQYFPKMNKMDSSSLSVDKSFLDKLINIKDDSDDQDDTETSEKKSLDAVLNTPTQTFSITSKEKLDYLFKAAEVLSSNKNKEIEVGQPEGSSCNFSGNERKVFIPVDSKDANRLTEFTKTGIDLDKIHDIVLLLQGSLMTHSKNRFSTATPTMKAAAAKQFSPIYTCQDQDYLTRIGGNGSNANLLFEKYVNEEIENEKTDRMNLRKQGGSNEPRRLAELYGLIYNEKESSSFRSILRDVIDHVF